MLKVMDRWLSIGVDGLRLDAIPYIYEREGTSCENLPETYEYLKSLRRHIDRKFKGKMLLAEANQWPEDAVAYFGSGDSCHMAFHFPVMPRLFMSIHMEDRFPVIDIMDQTPAIPDACQWAFFLRNHDELTLEMVTDEERDYMYRFYASDAKARINLGIRRRLAPLLGNNRRKIELMNGLLFSLPGTPVIYYGDEIGMGDNYYLGDRNGVRTPMQWSADKNAGFSRANPQKLYLPVIIDPEYHYESVNVESQQANPQSLLWWTKRLIALRQRYRALGRGSIEFLHPKNTKILSFVRTYGDEKILVVANLSRFVQYAELDLKAHAGKVPVELFGATRFPAITESLYLTTLGPHAFYWFSLVPAKVDTTLSASGLPEIAIDADWEVMLTGDGKQSVEEALVRYLQGCRWFQGKARKLKQVTLASKAVIGRGTELFHLIFATVDYVDAAQEVYHIPLGKVCGEKAQALLREQPGSCIAWIRGREGKGPAAALLYDAFADLAFCEALFNAMSGRKMAGVEEKLLFSVESRAKDLLKSKGGAPVLMASEQSNTSVVYGERLLLKMYRRLERGVHPEIELLGYLARADSGVSVPGYLGSIVYGDRRRDTVSLGVLTDFIPNEGDAWKRALGALDLYFESVSTAGPDIAESARVDQAAASFGADAALLGRHTARLHLALGGALEGEPMASEPFMPFYQRSVYQSMRNLTIKVMSTAKDSLEGLPVEKRESLKKVIALSPKIMHVMRTFTSRKLESRRIRCHGDLHLGQALYTGKDFVIFDFEGEPVRTLSERRLKRSPLRDVAGMLRSFHYASVTAYSRFLERGGYPPDKAAKLRSAAELWHLCAGRAFVDAYRKAVAGAAFLPKNDEEFDFLLKIFMLEKAVYELGYELGNRPGWVDIPVSGILRLMEDAAP